MLERLPAPVRRFLLYSICGGTGATLDTLTYATLNASGLHYQTANIVGYAAGAALSFVLNRAITFQVFDRPWRRLATFFGVAGVGYLSSAATLWALVERFNVDELAAKIMSLVVVVAVQFTLNSLVTFRPPPSA